MSVHPLSRIVQSLRRSLSRREGAGLADGELLGRFIDRRDNDAFEAIVRRHGPMVLNACRRVLGNVHDAEDAFQATFLVLVHRAASLGRRELMANWLYGVAYRTALKAKCKTARRRSREIQVQEMPHPTVEPEASWHDLKPLLDEELSRLPDKFRAAVVLCDLEGQPRKEAARKKLADQLTRRGITLSVGALTAALTGQATSAVVPASLTVATAEAAALVAAGQTAASVISANAAALTKGVLKAMLVTKTKLTVILLAGVGLAGAGAGVLTQRVSGDKPAVISPEVAEVDKPVPPVAPAGIGKIRGRVVLEADGRPVPGAAVRLADGDNSTIPWRVKLTKANDKGEFAYDGLAAGLYNIWALSDHLTSRSRAGNGKIVTVSNDGSAPQVLLKLRHGVRLRVKVVSQPTGNPISHARVRNVFEVTESDRDHFTDVRGEVGLLALSQPLCPITAGGKDHAQESRILNLEDAESTSIEFKLAPGGSLQGCVRGEDGRPISAAAVGTSYNNLAEDVKTDAQGRFRLDYLPLGQSLRLSIGKSAYLDHHQELLLTEGDGRNLSLDVVLKRRPHGGSVRGVVTDGQSKPIAGAELTNGAKSSGLFRQTRTDSEGRFLLDDVFENSFGHELVVRAKGYSPRRIAFKPGPARTPSEVTVSLEPGHRIKGRVVDQAGKPIRNVNVAFADGGFTGGIGSSMTTDAQGNFQFDSLPNDTAFSFSKERWSEIYDLKLQLDGDQEVVVTMKSQGVIKGRVVDAVTGKAIPHFTVRVTFSPDARPNEPSGGLLTQLFSGQEFTSAQGRFRLTDILAGMPLQVSISVPGYRRQIIRRAVAKEEAEAEPVEIRMKAEDPAKLVMVRGKLIDHRGVAVRGADVRLIVATERPAAREAFFFNLDAVAAGQTEHDPRVVEVQRKVTDADGRFVFEKVPGDAEIELAYFAKGLPAGRVDHLERLAPKDRTDLVVRAIAPARIVGTIDLKAFPDMRAILVSQSSRSFNVTLASDRKSFSVDDLPPGTYLIQISGSLRRWDERRGVSSSLARRSVTLEEGQEEKVAFGEADRLKQETPNP